MFGELSVITPMDVSSSVQVIGTTADSVVTRAPFTGTTVIVDDTPSNVALNTLYTPTAPADEGAYVGVLTPMVDKGEVEVRKGTQTTLDGCNVTSANSHVCNLQVGDPLLPLSGRLGDVVTYRGSYHGDGYLDESRVARNEEGGTLEVEDLPPLAYRIAEAAITAILGGDGADIPGLLSSHDFYKLLLAGHRRTGMMTTGKEYKVRPTTVGGMVRPLWAKFRCRATPDYQGSMAPYLNRVARARVAPNLMTPLIMYAAHDDLLAHNRIDFHQYQPENIRIGVSLKKEDIETVLQAKLQAGKNEDPPTYSGAATDRSVVWDQRLTPPPTTTLDDGRVVFKDFKRASRLLSDVAPSWR